MQDLVLYVDAFFISPYALSSFVALEEKQLPYDLVSVKLHEGEQRAAHFARSITGRVPALNHGELWLSESSAIAEYLDDAFPLRARLYPRDSAERARARQVQAWLRSDLMPIREQRPTSCVFYDQAIAPLDDAGKRARERLVSAADALIPDGHTQLFEHWCIADTDLAMMLMRLVKHEPVPDKLRAFTEAQWERPSVQKWVKKPRAAYVPY